MFLPLIRGAKVSDLLPIEIITIFRSVILIHIYLSFVYGCLFGFSTTLVHVLLETHLHTNLWVGVA